MSSEEEIVISFVFKRSGRDAVSVSQFYLSLSMDLKWFSPAESKEFVKKALERKLIVKNGDMISPNFDFRKTRIPLGFSPSINCLNIVTIDIKNAHNDIISCIVEKSGKPQQQILEEIKIISEEKNINFEVAALYLGKDYGIDIAKFFNEIEKNIFIENE